MCMYVAVLRLADRDAAQPTIAPVEPVVRLLSGIDDVRTDPLGREVSIWFDRDVISLGEIVRSIEDAGSRVRSVAQTRADAGVSQQPASA